MARRGSNQLLGVIGATVEDKESIVGDHGGGRGMWPGAGLISRVGCVSGKLFLLNSTSSLECVLHWCVQKEKTRKVTFGEANVCQRGFSVFTVFQSPSGLVKFNHACAVMSTAGCIFLLVLVMDEP